jgi:hypothetical protein
VKVRSRVPKLRVRAAKVLTPPPGASRASPANFGAGSEFPARAIDVPAPVFELSTLAPELSTPASKLPARAREVSWRVPALSTPAPELSRRGPEGVGRSSKVPEGAIDVREGCTGTFGGRFEAPGTAVGTSEAGSQSSGAGSQSSGAGSQSSGARSQSAGSLVESSRARSQSFGARTRCSMARLRTSGGAGGVPDRRRNFRRPSEDSAAPRRVSSKSMNFKRLPPRTTRGRRGAVVRSRSPPLQERDAGPDERVARGVRRLPTLDPRR